MSLIALTKSRNFSCCTEKTPSFGKKRHILCLGWLISWSRNHGREQSNVHQAKNLRIQPSWKNCWMVALDDLDYVGELERLLCRTAAFVSLMDCWTNQAKFFGSQVRSHMSLLVILDTPTNAHKVNHYIVKMHKLSKLWCKTLWNLCND
jgi:hypothetical protein